MKIKVEVLPEGQKKVLRDALNTYKAALETIEKNGSNMDVEHVLFDILTLKALLNYDVEIRLTQEQLERFTADNGVDFPEYIH